MPGQQPVTACVLRYDRPRSHTCDRGLARSGAVDSSFLLPQRERHTGFLHRAATNSFATCWFACGCSLFWYIWFPAWCTSRVSVIGNVVKCLKCPAAEPTMYIKEIAIQGFKSYKNTTRIEPFSAKHNVVGKPVSSTHILIEIIVLSWRERVWQVQLLLWCVLRNSAQFSP